VNDEGVMDASKQGYQHFFVLLGAASAVPPVIHRPAIAG
jgi:sulfoquinovose isomerase